MAKNDAAVELITVDTDRATLRLLRGEKFTPDLFSFAVDEYPEGATAYLTLAQAIAVRDALSAGIEAVQSQ